MKESKKLKEVWKWKDDVYEKTKNMTRQERIDFFNKGVSDFAIKTGMKIVTGKSPTHRVG